MLSKNQQASTSPPLRTTVRIFEGIDAVGELLPAWENLLAAIPTATIFSSWEWLSSWWSVFGQTCELITLGLFDCSGRLVGIAPLSFEMQRVVPGFTIRLVRLMGNGSTDADELNLLVLSGYEAIFVNTLLDYLVDHSQRWDVAEFNTLPDESPVPDACID